MPSEPSKESLEKATKIAEAWWNVQMEAQDQFPKLRDLIAIALDEAYRRGRETMRDEAEKLAANTRHEIPEEGTCLLIADGISKIPLTPQPKGDTNDQ